MLFRSHFNSNDYYLFYVNNNFNLPVRLNGHSREYAKHTYKFKTRNIVRVLYLYQKTIFERNVNLSRVTKK